MIDNAYLTQTLSELIAINSVNPSLGAGRQGEQAMARYLLQAMNALGLETRLQAAAPQRPNAIGLLRGAGGGPSLMWNAHTDTVGVNGMPEPFQPRLQGDRMFGRGSQDMKGSLAAMLAAAKAIQDSGQPLPGDLIVACVCDEEWSSLGTETLVKEVRADAAIVTEPTDLALARAHRGFIGFEVEVLGKAAHGSRYQEGIDAILMMGRFLHHLADLEAGLLARPAHALVGPPSLHASIIRGGTEMSTYPAQAYLLIERRTIPGETLAQAEAELREILDRLAAEDRRFRYTLNVTMERSPFEIDPHAPIVQAVHHSLAARMPTTPEHTGIPFWTDAAILADAGIPSVVLGPVGHGLHSAEEWVSLQSCVALAEILVDSARRFTAAP